MKGEVFKQSMLQNFVIEQMVKPTLRILNHTKDMMC